MDEALAAAEAAAKNAKRAMVLTTFAVTVALVVLAIDNGIKRGIVDEANKARGLLGELRDLVAAQKTPEVSDGTETAGEGGADRGAGVGAGDGLVPDAANGAANGKAPAAPRRAPARKPAGTGRGAPRHG